MLKTRTANYKTEKNPQLHEYKNQMFPNPTNPSNSLNHNPLITTPQKLN